MTVEQTKIVVKSQKCSMSAERKSAGRTTPICSEEQPGVFGMSKETIGGGQLICGSPGLKLPTAELVAAPLRIVSAREPPHFLPPQCKAAGADHSPFGRWAKPDRCPRQRSARTRQYDCYLNLHDCYLNLPTTSPGRQH